MNITKKKSQLKTPSSTQRVSNKIGISQFSLVCHLHDLGKASRVTKFCPMLLKYCKTFCSLN